MTNYQEARVKLTNTQLNKLKSEDEELARELFLTTTKTTKIRNV